MNLHEYQGKELLKSHGVTIQEGIIAHSLEGSRRAPTTKSANKPVPNLR